MKNLSLWALTNPWKAQIIISLLQIFLAFIAIYSGVWLFAHDIIIPSVFANIGLGLLFLALLLYPIRRSKYAIWKMSFIKQKSMDTLMLFSYMLVVISISNHDAKSAWNEPEEDQIKQKIVLNYNVKPKEHKKLSRKERKSVRKKIKKQFKQFVKKQKRQARNNKNIVDKIVGAVLLTLLMMFVVAVLACSIACSGANAMGLAVLIGGWIIAIVLGIYWGKKSIGRKKKNYQPKPSD